MINAKRKRVYAKASAIGKRQKTKPYSLIKAISPIFPGRETTRRVLTYAENAIAINPGAGTCGVYVFSANGLYDPNITGVGHQPTGFDQLMVLYQEYLVIKSRIKVTFINADNTNIQQVGVAVVDQAATSSDPRVYIENQQGVWTVCSQLGTGQEHRTLTIECDMSKQAARNVRQDKDWAGSQGSNPVTQKYFHCWGVDAAGTTDTSAITLLVQIDYYCVFKGQNLTSLS